MAFGRKNPIEFARREPDFFEVQQSVAIATGRPRSEIDRTPELSADIRILARRGIPGNILIQAARLAAFRGTECRQELFAIGFDRKHYWSLIATELGVAFIADLRDAELAANPGLLTTEAVRHAASVAVHLHGRSVLVIAPGPGDIDQLRERLRATPDLVQHLAIAAPETIRACLVMRRHRVLMHYAVNRLSHVFPRLSVSRLGGGIRPQPLLLFAVPLVAAAAVVPRNAIEVVGLLLTIFFFNCSFWKLAAAFSTPRPLRLEPVGSERLQAYTVMVPLYRESAIVPDLVRHLSALDYPASKLQVLLILEADDQETREAVDRHDQGAIFETVIVPPAGPRTKPKALTYALPFARGELVVVFDAEDRPEPDQLRRAAAAFRERPGLGCVQARLIPDNEDTWLARMFALEYAANFQVLLPALAAWRMPLPLGGSSNHFPRDVLARVGAWDPYNVTEDADLGVRLARFGYQSATILSHTFEEAPVTLRQWLPQRRRWVKGWIQTSLLCLAGPMPRSLRLPLVQQLAVLGMLTAGVVGLLLYPASLVAVVLSALAIAEWGWPEGFSTWSLFVLNLGNFLAILTAAGVATFRGLRGAGVTHLARLIPLLPIYWALMSFAAWQACFQFFRSPSAWEKTAHGVAGSRRDRIVSSCRLQAG